MFLSSSGSEISSTVKVKQEEGQKKGSGKPGQQSLCEVHREEIYLLPASSHKSQPLPAVGEKWGPVHDNLPKPLEAEGWDGQ